MKNNIKNLQSCFASVIITCCLVPAMGQGPEPIISERIAVMARPAADSVTLRWAPLSFKVWQSGNRHGYRVERYTLARNGRLLPRPEKAIIVSNTAPLPEAQWEGIVRRDKYAAIAAQALFGERFEVNLKESDVFTIVNKVRENEQRYLFALFSADMSPATARLSGLWVTDRNVLKGEKYLYRVVINSMDSLRGSIFISPDEAFALSRPENLRGDFHDRFVSLRWDKNSARNYTAYRVERSEDGTNFLPVADAPVVTVSPTEADDTRYGYAIDSLQDLSITYYYRVKGVTPFGESGPPSTVVSGRGIPAASQVPYISDASNAGNTAIRLRWQFPETDTRAITGFAVERAPAPTGAFTVLTGKLLPPEAREFEDRAPGLSNYYRVTAHGRNQALYTSPLYFAQLVDSIPPDAPAGVQAVVDDQGTVALSWMPNKERDIYGYRIYRAYHLREEPAQVTEGPITHPSFTDKIDLTTLNESVYYRVMALDNSQNHSALSAILKVTLPDKVPPQPPVFLPSAGSAQGICLRWLPGGSDDIVSYSVYRKNPDSSTWDHLASLRALNDTLFAYVDQGAAPGQTYHYTIIAVDDAGWESEPATTVAGTSGSHPLHPAIRWKKAQIDQDMNRITLRWEYDQPGVDSYKIFRSVNDAAPVLFQTVAAANREFTHRAIPGQHYSYRIMAVFSDGRKSFLSEEMRYQY